MVAPQEPWMTGWTASDPLEVAYASVPSDARRWTTGLRPYLEYRDLGLAGATTGRLGAQHIRSRQPMSSDWHLHDLDFQFFYVMAGEITIETEHGLTVRLGPGDCGYHPGLMRHREAISNGYEVVEITGPADGETFTGRRAPLPARAARLGGDRRPVYSYARTASDHLGGDEGGVFRHRDLGTAEPTAGRLRLQLVRAAGDPGLGTAATGWQYHTGARWFTVLAGTCEIRVGADFVRRLAAGDSMCLSAGPAMRHALVPLSRDYAALEMCVPAADETVAVDPPAAAAE